MLDNSLIEQLRTVFNKLDSPVTLVMASSKHEKQNELKTMLEQVAESSRFINLIFSDVESAHPKFWIEYNGKPNGINFSGIPGGHEFSSLVLAILNSDSKGKLPDGMILNRIRALKGPITLKTYISLSCENCPEVVQSLNLMAIFNENFEHEMIDGEFAQEQIEKLKIQGVPSVIKDNQLVHSGKGNLLELLEKLEEEFGKNSSRNQNTDLGDYDVVVVGAGPAGVASAIYTARKGLKTAIITDRMGGQLQDTKGIENMISIPYIEGPQLSASLAKHIHEYKVDVLEHRRVESVKNDTRKFLTLNSGETLHTKSLIIATGAKWRELGIDGEKEYLGRGVAYCPHCDGPFYKGKRVAVVGGGNSGVEAAIDLAGIVAHVTVVEFMPELKADKVLIDKLNSLPNTTIIKNAKTQKVIGNGERVTALEYEDRSKGESIQLPLDGIFVQIGLVPNSQFIKDIVKTNRFGEIEIDVKCRTDQKGIYAAGDVTTVPYKQIVVALGEGAKAGLSAFEDQMIH